MLPRSRRGGAPSHSRVPRHHGNVSSTPSFQARIVPASSPAARRRDVDVRDRDRARGCAVCPRVRLPVMMALLWTLVTADPGTPAANGGVATVIHTLFNSLYKPSGLFASRHSINIHSEESDREEINWPRCTYGEHHVCSDGQERQTPWHMRNRASSNFNPWAMLPHRSYKPTFPRHPPRLPARHEKSTPYHSRKSFSKLDSRFVPLRRVSRRNSQSMLIGYARVSTQHQNLDLQREALTKAGCKKVFDDILSRSRTERPGLS